jgi:hypothetical protein
MSQASIRRDLDAASGYQELLVPALMQEWARRVAEAAAIRTGLETRSAWPSCAKLRGSKTHASLQSGRGRFPSIRTMVEVDVRDWLRIVGITLDEELIEKILGESDTALRPFLAMDESGVSFDSPAVLTTATR